MNMLKPSRTAVAVSVALLCVPPLAFSADNTLFDNYTPLAGSAPANSLPASAPLALTSPYFSQQSLASRTDSAVAGANWDMITSNETGPSAGRYLFAPFEQGAAGVMRYDRQTGTVTTIVTPNTAAVFTVGDASRWAPWGSYLTAEETTRGRLFEVTNAVTAAAGTGNLVLRGIIPRVAHEGLAFDSARNMYFVDEFNGGSIYKYTSANPNAADGNGYFAAGQSFVLRVGDGSAFGGTGAASWVALTDANGTALAGATIVGGAIDGRATTDLAAFKGTNYNRPEDMEIQTLAGGVQRIYFATTDSQQVFSLDLNTTTVSEFVGRGTLNIQSGAAVGTAFTSPDNIAIDANGNIYIVEDQPGGQADIWFANDADRNGVAESVGRWASLATGGAEPTGLYFDPFNPNIAFVNVQHPTGGNDRLLQITAAPEPESIALMLAGLLGFAARQRKQRSV